MNYTLILPNPGSAEEDSGRLSGFLQNCTDSSRNLRKISLNGDTFCRAEAALISLVSLCAEDDIILFPASIAGRELAVRLAARLGGTAAVDVTEMRFCDDGLHVVRSLCAEHIRGDFVLRQKPFCIAINKSCPAGGAPGEDISKPSALSGENASAPAGLSPGDASGEDAPETVTLPADPLNPTYQNLVPQHMSSSLTESRLVIAAGRGLGSRAGADEAAALAEQLGAAFGVSRPVVMNAWRPMDELLGVSGSMIHPELCIVLGASGSPAFCAGISGSGTIIAVNQDPDAPIMKKSDICICGDWKDFLRAMVKYCNS